MRRNTATWPVIRRVSHTVPPGTQAGALYLARREIGLRTDVLRYRERDDGAVPLTKSLRSALDSTWMWRPALLLAALTLGMAFAHTLEMPEKMGYGPQLWTRVNQSLYGYFATVGGPVELANVGLLAVLAAGGRQLSRGGRRNAGWAAGCFAAALVVWFAVVNPANAEISRWAPGAVRSGWILWRDLWEFGHAARFALMLAGFVLLAKTAPCHARRGAPSGSAAGDVARPDSLRQFGTGR